MPSWLSSASSNLLFIQGCSRAFSGSSQTSTHPYYSLDVEKPIDQILPQTLGIYSPDFLAIREDRGKSGKACNALLSFVNLTVVSYHRSSDGTSSIDSLLIPTLLLWDFKMIIPPHTGLLKIAHSSPFSRFLMNLSKEGKSL
jgi:hypothetical protein